MQNSQKIFVFAIVSMLKFMKLTLFCGISDLRMFGRCLKYVFMCE